MGILSDFQSASNSTCEAYLQGKMIRSPFVGQMAKAKDLLKIIHSIVCGPFSEMARGGFFYLLPLYMIYQGRGIWFLWNKRVIPLKISKNSKTK